MTNRMAKSAAQHPEGESLLSLSRTKSRAPLYYILRYAAFQKPLEDSEGKLEKPHRKV